MGGSKPSAPTVIMPAETKPQQFQSVIPEKSFKDLAEQMGRIEKETGKIQDQRYDEVGTPAEIGARAKGTNMLAAAAYLSSYVWRHIRGYRTFISDGKCPNCFSHTISFSFFNKNVLEK